MKVCHDPYLILSISAVMTKDVFSLTVRHTKLKIDLQMQSQGQHGGRLGKILVVKILKPILDFNSQSEAEPPHIQTDPHRRDTELPQPSELPLPSHI